MWDLVFLVVFFCAAAAIYRFRKPILLRLARFDARNAARRAEELRERKDRFAHYRRAVLTAEESLEEVSKVGIADERTGQPVTRFLFRGERSLTRNEAETARRARAIAIARDFYAELDGHTLAREAAQEPAPSPSPASLPQPDSKVTPPRPS